jgi:hypothetical protein
VTLVPRLIASPREVARLFGSAFTIQIPLQDMANIKKDMTLISLLGAVIVPNKPNQQDRYQKYLN